MSEIIPSPMAEQTLERVLLLLSDETIAVSPTDLRGIRDSVAALIDLLQDAEELKKTSDRVRLWLMELKELAYQAEHYLDEVSFHILPRKVRDSSGFLNKLVLNSQLVHKIKNLSLLFQEILNEAIDLGLQRKSSYTLPLHIGLTSLENCVVEGENDVSTILSFLCDADSHGSLTVVPIFGAEGAGKTTLAKLVCQKAMEAILFDIIIWVSASDLSDENENELLGKMLQSLTGTNQSFTDKDAILEQLEEELLRKRFLLVLDDVRDDYIWWDDFKECLSEVSTKTRNAVVVTTCSEEIASIFETSYQKRHKLDLLSNGEFSSIMKEKDPVSILQLCFDSLPPCLKSCLSFCLIFPKAFQIQKVDLIQLWMADGLVESFDRGNICFNSLLNTCFLQGVERDDYGAVVSCKIVDFVHRLAVPICNSETLTRQDYLYAKSPLVDIPKYKAKNLRTLVLEDGFFQEFGNLESLRAIVFLNSFDMEELPSSIERLKHLRHLDVSNSKIRSLPDFVINLYNLQTLKFLKCEELQNLPRKKFNQMISLKNITFSFEHQMPFGLGQLNNLQTLSFFVVGSDRGGSILELECLNELRGHLDITRLEKVTDKNEAERANLLQKTKINGLSFQWSYGTSDRSSTDEEVFECLQPHPNIQKIRIKYYMGKTWPSWMLSPSDGDSFALNNLVSLTLDQCWNFTKLPFLGGLQFLKFLEIKHLKRVKYLYDEETKGGLTLFPSLKSLSLSWMDNLTEWSFTQRLSGVVFPHLEMLTIHSCAKLRNLPLKDSSALVKIDITDCDELRFSFYEQQSFPSLTRLSIVGCPKFTNLRLWLLSNTRVKEVKVRRCGWMKVVPRNLGMQSSLITLEISRCKGLTHFFEEILRELGQLRKLSIGAFSEKLDDFQYLNRIKDLPCLEELEIWGSEFFGRETSHLPDQLQQLTNLESLKITGFTTMEALPAWFSDLQSLWCLSLNYCQGLEYESTTTIIQQLPNLKHLYINGCHTLKENISRWNECSQITKIKIHFSEMIE